MAKSYRKTARKGTFLRRTKVELNCVCRSQRSQTAVKLIIRVEGNVCPVTLKHRRLNWLLFLLFFRLKFALRFAPAVYCFRCNLICWKHRFHLRVWNLFRRRSFKKVYQSRRWPRFFLVCLNFWGRVWSEHLRHTAWLIVSSEFRNFSF